MTLQKFLSFLLNRHFYYCRLDQFEDMYEGINQRHLLRLHLHQSFQNDNFTNTNTIVYKRLMRLEPEQERFLDQQRREYVTCWVTGQRESAAMWNLYSESGGVALRITCQKFLAILNEQSTYEPNEQIQSIHYGLVTYKNFVDRRDVDSKNFKVKKPSFRKDISFEHEREFRVCISVSKPLANDRHGISQNLTTFETLPLDIVTHPKAAAWQTGNVRKLLQTFAPSFNIKYSELRLR